MEVSDLCKVQMMLECEYKWLRIDKKEQFKDMMLHTKSVEVYNIIDIDNLMSAHFQDLNKKESQHQPSRRSGWTLYKCKHLIQGLSTFSPLRYIKLT